MKYWQKQSEGWRPLNSILGGPGPHGPTPYNFLEVVPRLVVVRLRWVVVRLVVVFFLVRLFGFEVVHLVLVVFRVVFDR